jgi:sirohydrochlorin ferrochelatase
VKRAILLVDHGSRRPEANALLDELAERIRPRVPDCVVVAAHLELAKPDIAEGIDRCVTQGATKIVLLPFFLGPGRHTTDDIPAQVECAAKKHPDVRILISESLGGHDALIDVALDRVRDADR